MDADIKKHLAKMKANWAADKDTPPGIPDGDYHLLLQKATVKLSGSQNLMVAREHVVVEGEQQGKVVRDFIIIEGEGGPFRFSKWCEQMGQEAPTNPDDIPDTVALINGEPKHYMAKVRASKGSDLRNVDILKVLEGEVEPAAEETPATEEAAEEAPPAADGEIKKGSTVSFEYEGGTLTGKVKEVKKSGEFLVQTADGSAYELDKGSLTLGEEEAAAEETSTEDDAKRAALLAFAQAQDIECTDESTTEELVEAITGFEYEKSELTPDEVELLTSIGAPFKKKAAPAPAKKVVVKPAPKPVAKAPVKASTKTAVKKK